MPTESEHFSHLQSRLAPLFHRVFADPAAPRTVVVVPGLSMDQELLSRIDGLQHYEERQLTLLMLLRLPATRIVFVTSTPVDPVIIDYHLNLLPGVPHAHARRRLTLLSAYDGSAVSLTHKLLARPRLLGRIREAIGEPALAHLSCFNATAAERTLAVALGIPLYACDPDLLGLGSKSGSREVFRAAGVPLPDGFENLRDAADVSQALAALRARDPTLERAVVKLNDGASGEGNAVFRFDGAPSTRAGHGVPPERAGHGVPPERAGHGVPPERAGHGVPPERAGHGVPPERAGHGALTRWVAARLPHALAYEAPGEHWPHFAGKLAAMGGIVEAWVGGAGACSPSAQLRITPTQQLELISTHDQVLGGATGQKFLGCSFPADAAYRLEIQRHGVRVGEELRRRGVIGRFGVDFVCVPLAGGGWRTQAIEINLRKGGTTHPFQTLQYLTQGHCDPASGEFHAPNGQRCVYFATDNLQNPAYRRLTPEDLIDIAVEHGLHFDQTRLEGVTFSLIGALSEFGKLGAVSIARSPERARELYRLTVDVLDRASA
jgi:hypothetical protein